MVPPYSTDDKQHENAVQKQTSKMIPRRKRGREGEGWGEERNRKEKENGKQHTI